MFQIVTKRVQGPRGVVPAYDIEFDGKFVTRCDTKDQARIERDRMQQYAERHGLMEVQHVA